MGGWTDVQIRLASDGAERSRGQAGRANAGPAAAEQQHGRLQPAFRNRMDPSGCIVRWPMQPAHGHAVRIVLFQEA